MVGMWIMKCILGMIEHFDKHYRTWYGDLQLELEGMLSDPWIVLEKSISTLFPAF